MEQVLEPGSKHVSDMGHQVGGGDEREVGSRLLGTVKPIVRGCGDRAVEIGLRRVRWSGTAASRESRGTRTERAREEVFALGVEGIDVTDEQHAPGPGFVDASTDQFGVAAQRGIDVDYASGREVVEERTGEKRGAAAWIAVNQNVVEPRVVAEAAFDDRAEETWRS
jgi:hypothetical protein